MKKDKKKRGINDRSILAIDPRRQFGRVCIFGTRIPAETIAQAVFAGDSIEEMVSGYDITREQVLMCCWWLVSEIEHKPTRCRRKGETAIYARWGAWADEAFKVLGGWEDGPCPDPPEENDV